MQHYTTLVLHFTGEVSLDTETLRQWKLSVYDPAAAYPVFVRWRGITADEILRLPRYAKEGSAARLQNDALEQWKSAYIAAADTAEPEKEELRRLLDRAAAEYRSGHAKLAVVADGVGARPLIAAMRYYSTIPSGPPVISSALLRLPVCSSDDALFLFTLMPEFCAQVTVLDLDATGNHDDSFATPFHHSWRHFVAGAIADAQPGSRLADFRALVDRLPTVLRSRCHYESLPPPIDAGDTAVNVILKSATTLQRLFTP